MTLTYLTIILQIIVALGLLNVWLLRFNRATEYRGGAATSMPEEFSVYGLPNWACYAVGGMKILCALLLLLGIWVPSLVAPAASTIAVLMVGALAMHAKVRDSVTKFLPALSVLIMCLVLIFS